MSRKESYVSREEWGARKTKNTVTMHTPVKHIFIHHTAGPSASSKEECSRIMKGIQNYHMDTHGWADIGYNFVIGGDGRVYAGRGWDRVGAHTYGFNRKAIAFSLMGNFDLDGPPEIMLNATKDMIERAKNEMHVTSDYKIHGHRDADNVECPGQALYDIIKTWENFEAGPLK